MNVLLLSTYELGRQPFGLASPAAWLRQGGNEVTCLDLSLQELDEAAVHQAGLIGFSLPMHTATRLAVPVIERVKRLNPSARLCCYGLYAPLNEAYLRSLGVIAILGGEFEPGLLSLAAGGDPGPLVSLDRLQFRVPDRTGLPAQASYAQLHLGEVTRIVGYTEASRGCKHLCRHCPVTPVYNGVFRVVQADVVLEDIRRQVADGAEHITFGDPDFFNGPLHARRIIESLHREFPQLTYDATIKVEHLRKHADLLPLLKDTGCVMVTSAVESLDDAVLERLDKGHTFDDFVWVLDDVRRANLTLAPTFIAFTPWTSVSSYGEMLRHLHELDLVDAVSPVQLALRLLIPAGSRLLELDDVRFVIQGYDEPGLMHRWAHRDPAVDALAQSAMRVVEDGGTRRESFRKLWNLSELERLPDDFDLVPRAAIPYLDEPWYC